MLLHNSTFSYQLAFFGSIALLAASLIFCFRKTAPRYLRTLPYFCLVNVLSDYFVYLFPAAKEKIFLLYTVIELLYFSYLLFTLIRSSHARRTIKILDALFLLYLAYYLIRHRHIPPFGYPIMIESVILVIACSIYFVQIILKPVALHLTAATEFWFITGILFYFCMQIPLLTISSYYYGIGNPSLGDTIYSANSYTLVIAYLLFIVALLCTRTQTYPKTY